MHVREYMVWVALRPRGREGGISLGRCHVQRCGILSEADEERGDARVDGLQDEENEAAAYLLGCV